MRIFFQAGDYEPDRWVREGAQGGIRSIQMAGLPLDGETAFLHASVMMNAMGMQGARVSVHTLVLATFAALGGLAPGQEVAPPRGSAAAHTQRASGLDESLTLLEIVGAFAEADRSEQPVSREAMKRLEKFISTAPDAICPLVAEDTLRLKQPWLWPQMVRRAFVEWAMMDGAAAMQRVESIKVEERKGGAFDVTCQIWMQRQPERYWAWLLRYPDEAKRNKLTEKYMEWMAFKNPSFAVGLLSQISSTAVRDTAMDDIAWRWGEKDSQAALAWVRSLDSSVNKYHLTERIVLGLTSKDKAAGVALAMTLPDATMRSNFGNEAHQVWSNHDLRAAITSFLKLPADYQYSATGGSFGSNTEKMGVEEVLGLAEELATLDPRNLVRVRFLESAARRRRDSGRMQDALAIQDKLEPGPERLEAMRWLAIDWAKADLAAASKWIEGLPAGAEKEVALEGAAWGLLNVDPPRAFVWTEKLADKEAARDLRGNLFLNWWRVDKKAAPLWLEQTAYFNDKEKAGLLKRAEEMGMFFKY